MSIQPRATPALLMGALGIVFGDIGTSPIYSLRESFRAARPGGAPIEAVMPAATALGVLSLLVWTLLIVVTLKYVVLVMRADNDGEGGIVALLALVLGRIAPGRRHTMFLMLGIFGAALFYGDGMITPAISVLSAIEGLQVATPLFQPYVVPITLVVLAALFLFQSRGTARIGALFGPVMVLWFAVLAIAGAAQLINTPGVLRAIDPVYAAQFCWANPARAVVTLGSVFLAVTGAEALYADMSHFGRSAIRIDWAAFALPALLLNYAGQAALVLADPAAAANPFFRLVPGWGLYPLVILSTAATVIASQAVISGAFSLTQQAMLLGLVPRLIVRQTSAEAEGQIYIPQVNYLLAAGVFVLVLAFRSSDALAAAYGIAVTGTMLITTVLLAMAMRLCWGWAWPWVACVAGPLLVVDLGFFGANALKIPQGGWVPLLIGLVMFLLMTTWRAGRRIVLERLGEAADMAGGSISSAATLTAFLDRMATEAIHRIPGTGIYFTSRPDQIPFSLLENLKHNQVLHSRVVLLNVVAERAPRAPAERQLEHVMLGQGFERVTFHLGFSETPDIPALLAAHVDELKIDPVHASFFIGREVPVPRFQGELAYWREQIFAFLTRNSVGAADYFRVPPERVVELGTRVEM